MYFRLSRNAIYNFPQPAICATIKHMLYVQESLAENENLLHIGKFSIMYTVNAIMKIVFGVVLSLMIIAGGVIIYKQLGKFPPDATFRDGILYLHPLIRLAAFGMFVFGILGYISTMIIQMTTEIAVTDLRLIHKKGLIARNVGEIAVDRIEGVSVSQSMLGRLFDYGRLAVRGMGVGQVTLPPIEKPLKFRQAVETAKNRAKKGNM